MAHSRSIPVPNRPVRIREQLAAGPERHVLALSPRLLGGQDNPRRRVEAACRRKTEWCGRPRPAMKTPAIDRPEPWHRPLHAIAQLVALHESGADRTVFGSAAIASAALMLLPAGGSIGKQAGTALPTAPDGRIAGTNRRAARSLSMGRFAAEIQLYPHPPREFGSASTSQKSAGRKANSLDGMTSTVQKMIECAKAMPF